MAKSVFLSTLVSTVVLFFWSGVTQNFPWGVPTVQVVSTASDAATDGSQPAKTIKLAPGSLTTEQFEKQMVGKISTLTTDQSFSWIISKPISYYGLTGYFVREIITQFFVALLLSLLLWNLRALKFKLKLRVVMLVALAAVVATFGQNLNWVGMPPAFAIGAAVNLVIGWMIVATILSKWFIKTPA